MIVNGVDITIDILEAIIYWGAGQYENFGYCLGKAIFVLLIDQYNEKLFVDG